MAAVRNASATWQGDLLSGSGRVSAETSAVFADVPLTWKARTEASDGLTSPEELLAAAHAACFSMASSNELSKAGFVPELMEVSAAVSADKTEAGWTVTSSALTLRARVPGVDEATFRQAVEAARDGCPISRAISGSVHIALDATLVG
ncbi:MAG: OsmC family peroxiredoxin [Chloroflexi bacterium]|nr:OsmC family peroxiredoxin [Chloroflexota bacterium]